MTRRQPPALPIVAATALLLALLTASLPLAPAQYNPAPSTESATENPATPTSSLYLKISNSHSGLAVPGVRIEANGQPIQPDAAQGALLMLTLPEGPNQLQISAENHQSMEITITVDPAENPIMEIELDPQSPTAPPEIPPDIAILRGTVADIDTAEAIPGAKLILTESTLTAQTTATGEYRFEIRTGPAATDNRPAVTLEIQAPEYQTLRLTNIPLAPGSEALVPVKMSRPTSTTQTLDVVEIDQWTAPGKDFLSDWIFDVTIR